MKKFFTLTLTLVAMIMTTFTLTSCDEDAMQADYLDGEWRGDFGMWYEDRFGYEWEADYTIMKFYQSGLSSRGWGKQYDYYSHGPLRYQYYEFDWFIDNGIVKLRYRYDHDLDVDIYDYSMANGIFKGYFGNTHTRFWLEKYRDFRWDNYSGNYMYYYEPGYVYDGNYYDRYYDIYRSKNSSDDDKSLVLKRGNRFNEK